MDELHNKETSRLIAITSLPRCINKDIKSGASLAGDDLTEEGLKRWFAEEREAFYHDNAGNSEVDPWYAYMRYLNERLGFSRLKLAPSRGRSVLVLGPGSGIEIDHFATSHPDWELCFYEASDNFKSELKARYPHSSIVDAIPAGNVSLESGTQDLVCAFSVLHHVPNVSRVMGEIHRVLKPGGILLIREPCSSMGDWRLPRSATPNERGIGRNFLLNKALTIGFEVTMRPRPVLFAPLNTFLKKLRADSLLPASMLFWIDRLASRAISWNDWYWRDRWYKKLGPSAYFYVFRKSQH